MPAATPTYSWEHVINQQIPHGGSTDTRNRTTLFRLKQALTGALTTYDAAGSVVAMSAPFVVVASSNGTTASAADNWASVADVNHDNAGAVHSWIHLRLTDYFGSGDHLHLLIDFIPATGVGAIGRVSWARGATGYNNDGTTINRPTLAAAVEIIVRDGATTGGDSLSSDMLFGDDGGSNDVVLHFQISDDGQAGRWFVFNGGFVVAVAGWQRDEDGPASRTNDFLVYYCSRDVTTDVWQWTSGFSSLALFRSLTNAGSEFGVYGSIPMVNSSTANILPSFNVNAFDNSRFMAKPLLFNTVGTLGCMGVLSDWWWGRTADANGEGGPVATPAFRKVGELLTPWPVGQNMLVS